MDPDHQLPPAADDVGELIVGGAYERGLIRWESVESILAIDGAATKIARGLGPAVDSETAFLVTIMVDDSGSIFHVNNQLPIASGHNDIVDELQALAAGSPQDRILLHTRCLNGKVLNPYRPIGDVVRLGAANYSTGGGTPLYDQTVITLGTVIAKSAQLTELGCRVRTFTLIITDGDDRDSVTATPKSVGWLASDMGMSGDHIIAGMGVSDDKTDFRRVFREMGVKPGWILNVSDARGKIREAFQHVVAAVALGAESESSFTTLALGPGFGS